MEIVFTPKQSEAIEALQSEKYNLILFGGAIRGGKTVWGLASLLILCAVFPRSRWCVIRENIERIRTTTIPSFKKLEPSGRLKETPFEYTHPNGSVILFKGENYNIDKDLDWMKGLEVNGFLFEEINECQQQTLFKAFERSGAWIIPNTQIQPKPIILATCNPSFGWVKDLVYDKWEKGILNPKWLYIPAKITDNPHLPEEYKESLKNLPRYEYEVYVEGNWNIQLKTGGEFLRGFDLNKHVKRLVYDPSTTLHISVDSNVYPYISVTIWQLIKGERWEIRQIHELPCIDPDNTASRAGKNVAKYLKSIQYTQRVLLYGDRSTKNRNNIDDDKRSFFQIFKENIEGEGFRTEDKMLNYSPSVSTIGDFVNAIFNYELDFAEIEIDESCKKSIGDYIETKTDRDGSILKKRITDPKTGVSYEPNGHLTDTLKDFIVQAFKKEFDAYENRFKQIPSGMTRTIDRKPKFTF